MPSLDRARDFVYRHGAPWERALFGHLFDGRPVEEPLRFLSAYKNPDGGFGHGLEHDLKAPDSHVPALEFLLFIHRNTGLPVARLLDGTVAWLERRRHDDGSFRDPDTLRDHPIAPWWREWGGQPAPDAVTGLLTRLDLASAELTASTRRWVEANLTLDAIREIDWLFMAYHPVDYFMNTRDFPDLERYQEATIAQVIALAEAAPEAQAPALLPFLAYPKLAERVPAALIERALDLLVDGQQEDGSWRDEHGLSQWYPFTTIGNLVFLRRHGRL